MDGSGSTSQDRRSKFGSLRTPKRSVSAKVLPCGKSSPNDYSATPEPASTSKAAVDSDGSSTEPWRRSARLFPDSIVSPTRVVGLLKHSKSEDQALRGVGCSRHSLQQCSGTINMTNHSQPLETPRSRVRRLLPPATENNADESVTSDAIEGPSVQKGNPHADLRNTKNGRVFDLTPKVLTPQSAQCSSLSHFSLLHIAKFSLH